MIRNRDAREKEIRAARDKKNALIEKMNPKWADYKPRLFNI